MSRILLTGFEPFGASPINASAKVVDAFANHEAATPGGIKLTTFILPVEHQRAPRFLFELIETHQPHAIINLGEARGRNAISIEQTATNQLNYRIPDNAGNQIENQPVNPQGPTAYQTTLPISAIIKTLHTQNIPAEVSKDAGSFLCNEIMYHTLHQLAQTNQRSTPAGFIHLPWLPDQVAQHKSKPNDQPIPSMSFQQMTLAISCILATIHNHLQPHQA